MKKIVILLLHIPLLHAAAPTTINEQIKSKTIELVDCFGKIATQVAQDTAEKADLEMLRKHAKTVTAIANQTPISCSLKSYPAVQKIADTYVAALEKYYTKKREPLPFDTLSKITQELISLFAMARMLPIGNNQ